MRETIRERERERRKEGGSEQERERERERERVSLCFASRCVSLTNVLGKVLVLGR